MAGALRTIQKAEIPQTVRQLMDHSEGTAELETSVDLKQTPGDLDGTEV